MASGDNTSYADVAIRVATTPITADSATFTTTETSLGSATFTQNSGWVYRIGVQCAFSTATQAASLSASELVLARVREDTLTGNILTQLIQPMPTSGSSGYPLFMYVEYTAGATGSKTIVFTGVKSNGTGAFQLRAGANHPVYITVDRIPQ